MGIRLRKRKLSDGRQSLYLDIIDHGRREREYLHLYLVPGSTKENRDTMLLADGIRAMRELKAASEGTGIKMRSRDSDFVQYMDGFIAAYKGKDKRVLSAMRTRFVLYYGQAVKCSSLTPDRIASFKAELMSSLSGETPFNYFKKLKRILSKATKDGLFSTNPTEGLTNSNPTGGQVRKDILSRDEIALLWDTPCGNAEVKRSFLFAMETGLRYVDIKAIRPAHYKSDGYILMQQAKTSEQVMIPLSSRAKFLLDGGLPFRLSVSHNAVNKCLKRWAVRAGITKHVTFHVARHTFITNLLHSGVDLKTASHLAGHTSTKYTERYTHISNKLKYDAIAKMEQYLKSKP